VNPLFISKNHNSHVHWPSTRPGGFAGFKGNTRLGKIKNGAIRCRAALSSCPAFPDAARRSALTTAGRLRISQRDIPGVKKWSSKVTRSTVFTTNRSQAVRLPKSMTLPPNVRHVEITKLGRSRLISPADQSWDAFFDGPTASADFMIERHQPPARGREAL
jgi:antitoxin VapB